ncbi:hypothetical protein F0562_024480 [Nyssa sinensis]|uniref:Uncharacterized protein n=1 Tax=Nyssa sinensis TaxID=561372 RepID=A0A5J5BHL1_9ASTE|nr:hypothetical protein F0562_024480 [Nyssa sinensis]
MVVAVGDHNQWWWWWSIDTIAVVTGANRGIGFDIAHQLAVHGLTVILTSRDAGVGDEARKVLQERGLTVFFHQLDVVDPSSIKVFAEWVQQDFGGIDILVNNAGVNFNHGTDNSVEFAEQTQADPLFSAKASFIINGELEKSSLLYDPSNPSFERRVWPEFHPPSPIRFETLHGSILKPFVGSFSRFYSSNQSLDIDLANEESKRRLFNRLLYRSKQRGYLELDLVLGKWVEDHIQSMDEDGIKALVDVLDLNPIDHHALRIIISVVSSLM